MNWLAHVYVMPKEEVLDPQGVAILGALRHLEFDGIVGVRSGRLFELHITNCTEETAQRTAQDAAARLLANTVVETYQITVEPTEPSTQDTSEPASAGIAQPASAGIAQGAVISSASGEGAA